MDGKRRTLIISHELEQIFNIGEIFFFLLCDCWDIFKIVIPCSMTSIESDVTNDVNKNFPPSHLGGLHAKKITGWQTNLKNKIIIINRF